MGTAHCLPGLLIRGAVLFGGGWLFVLDTVTGRLADPQVAASHSLHGRLFPLPSSETLLLSATTNERLRKTTDVSPNLACDAVTEPMLVGSGAGFIAMEGRRGLVSQGLRRVRGRILPLGQTSDSLED